MRCAAGTHHRGALVVDELGRLGMPVLAGLDPAARVVVALERVDVALLLGGRRAVLLATEEAPEHGPAVPDRRYTNPCHWPIRLVA